MMLRYIIKYNHGDMLSFILLLIIDKLVSIFLFVVGTLNASMLHVGYLFPSILESYFRIYMKVIFRDWEDNGQYSQLGPQTHSPSKKEKQPLEQSTSIELGKRGAATNHPTTSWTINLKCRKKVRKEHMTAWQHTSYYNKESIERLWMSSLFGPHLDGGASHGSIPSP